jgi:hypothetical protein
VLLANQSAAYARLFPGALEPVYPVKFLYASFEEFKDLAKVVCVHTCMYPCVCVRVCVGADQVWQGGSHANSTFLKKTEHHQIFEIMPDEKAGVPRTAYKGTVCTFTPLFCSDLPPVPTTLCSQVQLWHRPEPEGSVLLVLLVSTLDLYQSCSAGGCSDESFRPLPSSIDLRPSWIVH